MSDFSPREIVSELDRHIIAQSDAKRAVAIALRNRWRRKRVPEELRSEITPKNILMIGPTGVGKTEISRRLAKLAQAPFIKVEATKFTEVGYVGRDVEQIIRDLVEASIAMLRDMKREQVKAQAELEAERRILDALAGEGAGDATREMFRKKLLSRNVPQEASVRRTGRYRSGARDVRHIFTFSRYRYSRPARRLYGYVGFILHVQRHGP